MFSLLSKICNILPPDTTFIEIIIVAKTLMFHILLVVDPLPRLKLRSLQASEASTYTGGEGEKISLTQ